MAKSAIQVKQEQLRKRRANLLRRHNDFWRLYKIKSWLTMEAEDGRIFGYHSHPELPIPTSRDKVSNSQILNPWTALRKLEKWNITPNI